MFPRSVRSTIIAAILITVPPCLSANIPGGTPPSQDDLFGFARYWMDTEHEPSELILLLMGFGPTPTSTSTETGLPLTETATPSATDTESTTETPTPSPSASSTESDTPTSSQTPTETHTATPTSTSSPTPSPSITPTNTLPGDSFVNFENAPIHPVDLSPNGSLLAVINLPDYRVLLFDVSSGTPVALGSVPVGVDPVTARFRTDTELWVVNHISDTISIVDVPSQRVVRTLPTADEPCDVVFAGNPSKAFVSCSQANRVLVFDAESPSIPGRVVEIDAEDPRSLAVSPDGATVYAAIFESGNGSTEIGGGARDLGVINFPPNTASYEGGPYGGQNPPPNNGGLFDPPLRPGNPQPPRVPLIVKKDMEGKWRDDNGTDWTEFVSGDESFRSGRVPGWDLPDRDVALIDVDTELVVGYIPRLMNICMSLAVHPTSGKVTVVGTDGTNEVRFEPVINGRFHHVLCTISEPVPDATATIVDLNPHLVPYSATQTVETERMKSLGDPRGIVWESDGLKGYVSGMGSNNVVAVDATGSRTLGDPIPVGQGPTGMALDEGRNRLYVLNRFEGSVSVVSITTESELTRVSFFDPTPETIRTGRKHLYDTHKNSGLGHISCGSCHVDSRMDRLGWDLGDPSGEMKSVNGASHNLGGNLFGLNGGFENFHPMKGPMMTQTLQDIIGHEPLHWRGDRDGLEEFNGAFASLQAGNPLTPTEMQEFEDFLDTITFPPNPFRNLDNTLPTNLPLPGHFTTGRFSAPGVPLPNGNAVRGLSGYRDQTNRLDQGAFACVMCHTLPTGMGTDYTLPGVIAPPFVTIPLGPNGERHHSLVSVDGTTNKSMKIPHLRNIHEKTGCNFTQTSNRAGFGYQHDGTVDSIERFLSLPAFNVSGNQEVADLVALMLSFSGSELPEGSINNPVEPPGPESQDSHAAVGAQRTESSPNSELLVTQMIQLALTGKVELSVHGRVNGFQRGAWLEAPSGLFRTDIDGELLTPPDVRAIAAPGVELTYTVVPRLVGRRFGIDQDEDGFGNHTERMAGSDPEDPSSTPPPGP